MKPIMIKDFWFMHSTELILEEHNILTIPELLDNSCDNLLEKWISNKAIHDIEYILTNKGFNLFANKSNNG